jgi:RNA polymerase sigma-B factor
VAFLRLVGVRPLLLRQNRGHAGQLFLLFAGMPADDDERRAVRDRLVEEHLPLVRFLARRYRDRGEPYDDLVQVGTIGLIKAIDRFDLDRGVEFSTFATPTILGEIKRHFRDKGWVIRVPRRLQELRPVLAAATAELSQNTGRAPTVPELAAHLRLPEEVVIEGITSNGSYSTLSLDAARAGDDDQPSIAAMLGADDDGLIGVENRESLKPLLERLPARERRIILLRFFKSMTQSEIAAELGISQMHVSRLLARTLTGLREGLLTDQ